MSETFGEYADSLSPQESDTTVVVTTVTAIRSLEIDLELLTFERDLLLEKIREYDNIFLRLRFCNAQGHTAAYDLRADISSILNEWQK